MFKKDSLRAPVDRISLDLSKSLAQGVVGCWVPSQESGGLVKNLKGGKPGVGSNISFKTTPAGRVLVFNATTTVVTLPVSKFLDGVSPLTICCYCYPISQGEGGLGRFFDKPNFGSMAFGNAPDNIFFSRTGASATAAQRNSAASSMTYNRWQSIVATWDGSVTGTNIHLYVDGTELSYLSATDATAPLVNDAGTALSIGNRASDTARTFDGYMAYQAWWNRVLNTSEIRTLAVAPYAMFKKSVRRKSIYSTTVSTTTNINRVERKITRGVLRGIGRGR